MEERERERERERGQTPGLLSPEREISNAPPPRSADTPLASYSRGAAAAAVG